MNARAKEAQKRRAALMVKPTGLVVSKGAPVAVRKRTVSRPVSSSPAPSHVLQVGSLVRAADRDNYGRVVGVDYTWADTTVSVHFRNPESGAEATVDFPSYMLTVVH